MKRVAREHATGRNRPLLRALHERIEPAFPPLIERGRAGRGQRRAEDGVKKRQQIDRTPRTEIKADRGRQQHQQG